MVDIKGLNLAFLHLTAVIGGIGGSFFLVFILSPVAQKLFQKDQYHKLIARVITRFHPFYLGCYGFLVLTGAWILTRYKIDAGVNYFHEYGNILFAKLALVFFAILIACYQFFGLGTLIVAMAEGEVDSGDMPKKIRLLWITSWINLVILLGTVYLGLALTRA